jgi:hypothetical protein
LTTRKHLFHHRGFNSKELIHHEEDKLTLFFTRKIDRGNVIFVPDCYYSKALAYLKEGRVFHQSDMKIVETFFEICIKYVDLVEENQGKKRKQYRTLQKKGTTYTKRDTPSSS